MAINFPDSPSDNDIYTVNGKRWIYSSGKWSIYGSTAPDATASDTEPSGVGDGHIWYRSDQSQTLIRYDNTWVEVGSAGGFDSSSTNFPTSLDSATGFAAVEALQAKVGVDGSAVTTSIDYQLNTGYRYHSTLYFTSTGTFTKASYPWLRAIRVTVQAGGGGGGHADTTGAGQISVGGGGGAGTWAQSFITDIASLAASVTVTVGAAGNGGLYATSTAATAGGDSSFGSGAAYEVSAGGGGGGGTITRSNASTGIGGAGGGGGVGDIYIRGGGGFSGTTTDPANAYSGTGGKGASSLLGNSGRDARANQGAGLSEGYGAGGTGYARVASLTGVDGRDGTAGIVIVELYA